MEKHCGRWALGARHPDQRQRNYSRITEFSSPSSAGVSRNSPMTRRSLAPHFFGAALFAALGLLVSCGSPPAKAKPSPPPPVVVTPPPRPPPAPPPENLPPVMLGIDVLEADGFKAIAGKK